MELNLGQCVQEGYPLIVSCYFKYPWPLCTSYIPENSTDFTQEVVSILKRVLRIIWHKVYPRSFTSLSDDWQLFLLIENLTYTQARAIEKHIKNMHSKIFIQNLMKYPEMVSRLKQKYS